MKWKPILKILSLFMIGMALGAFIMGGYVKHKMDNIHRSRGGDGFSEHLLRITGAKGDEEIKVKELGSQYGVKFEEIEEIFKASKLEILDSLEKDGTQILEGDVKERFLFHLDKMKKGPPGKKKAKGN